MGFVEILLEDLFIFFRTFWLWLSEHRGSTEAEVHMDGFGASEALDAEKLFCGFH